MTIVESKGEMRVSLTRVVAMLRHTANYTVSIAAVNVVRKDERGNLISEMSQTWRPQTRA